MSVFFVITRYLYTSLSPRTSHADSFHSYGIPFETLFMVCDRDMDPVFPEIPAESERFEFLRFDLDFHPNSSTSTLGCWPA